MSIAKNVDQKIEEVCEHFPELKRMIYCYGQMLGVKDFMDEQTYFRNKIALINRCLHGYGVVCGLLVDQLPPEGDPCEQKQPPSEQERDPGVPPEQEKKPGQQIGPTITKPAKEPDKDPGDRPSGDRSPIWLRVNCGMALDGRGRELVVRHPLCFNVWDLLSDADAELASKQTEGFCFDLKLCYGQHKSHRQQLEYADCLDNGQDPRYIYTRWHEVPCVRLKLVDWKTAERDRQDPREDPDEHTCDPCCCPPQECCIRLARICVRPSQPPHVDIDNRLRRLVAVYQTTTITGVNWHHGATLSRGMAGCLLEDGLVINFSRSIAKDSIPPKNAIVDVFGVDGEGIGQGHALAFPTSTDLIDTEAPGSPEYRKLKIKVPQFQLNQKDRVHIIVRCEFILDNCCRPVDGNHVGGLVPFTHWDVPDHHRDEFEYILREQSTRTIPQPCRNEYGVARPFVSGNGTPGGTFESWFFIQSDEECQRKMRS